MFKEEYEITFRDALARHTGLSGGFDVRSGVLKDIGFALVFSIMEAFFFIRDASRKAKAAAAAAAEAAAKNPAEF